MTSRETHPLDRRPPYDLDAEQAVLGSIFVDPRCADDLRAILRAEDFFDEAHRAIWETLQGMADDQQAIDVALFSARAKQQGIYETIGGAATLAKVIAAVPNAAHACYYARVVADKAQLRRIVEASSETLREAYEERQSSAEVLSRAEDRLFGLRDQRNTQRARHIREVCHDTVAAIDAAMNGTGETAIPTGFTDLDRMLGGGLRAGELVIVAARPSMGKSALTTDFALSIARDRPAAFFSLEMSGVNLCERMLASVGNLPGMAIRNRTLSSQDRLTLIEAAGEIASLQLHVDDNSRIRVGDIAASARIIENQTGQKLQLIVVDYLQFVTPDDPKVTREQQVAATARRLKTLAREHNCPVVAVCAVNRKNEDGNDKRPKLSMLRESGSIEFEADVVLLLHREEYYRRGQDADDCKGLAEIIIAKQRNGPCGTIELRWDAEHTCFQNLAPERLQEFDDYNEMDHGDRDLR